MKKFKELMIIGFYIVILFSIQNCTSTQKVSASKENQGWKVVKVDKSAIPSWTIYSRRLAGNHFLEYRIEGAIASSPKTCAAVFKQDILNLSEGRKKDKDYDFTTYEVLEESEASLLTYVVHNEPFPFKDTEMSVRYDFFVDSEGGAAGVQWKEGWEESQILPSKKLSRVEIFRGSWHFSSTSNQTSQAVNKVQFDAKKMPYWLVNKMVKKFLVGGLEKIREMATESR